MDWASADPLQDLLAVLSAVWPRESKQLGPKHLQNISGSLFSNMKIRQ
jgi:hypothetical protein